jgi:hypothetical protein
MRDFAKYGKEQKMEDSDYGGDFWEKFRTRFTDDVYKEIARNPKDYGLIEARYDPKDERWHLDFEHFGAASVSEKHLTQRERRVLNQIKNLNKYAKHRYYKANDISKVVMDHVEPEDWTPALIQQITTHPEEYGFGDVQYNKDNGGLKFSYGPEPNEIPDEQLPPVLKDYLALHKKLMNKPFNIAQKGVYDFKRARKDEFTPEVLEIIRSNPLRFGEEDENSTVIRRDFTAPKPTPLPKPHKRDADGNIILHDWEQKQLDDLEKVAAKAEAKKLGIGEVEPYFQTHFFQRNRLSGAAQDVVEANLRKYGFEAFDGKNFIPIDFSTETRATPTPTPTPTATPVAYAYG